MEIDILIYAVIAIGLIVWLKNTLGTRHGSERQRPNPFAMPPENKSERTASGSNDNAPAAKPLPPLLPQETVPDAEAGLVQIAIADRNFDSKDFLEKAKDAFVMIVTAFAAGDKPTLKMLLADNVYKAFEHAIAERERKGETVETDIHVIKTAKIVSAKVEKQKAIVSIRFTAEETCVIRDKDGNILSGDPDRVTEMTDLWTFTRNVKSKDPVWHVSETRDDIPEDHDAKTPLPEA